MRELWTTERHGAGQQGTGLYVHVPFCLRKCRYCDFNSYALREGQVSAYVSALHRELELYSKSMEGVHPAFTTVFVGGGTPTVLQVDELADLLDHVLRFAGLDTGEVTVEANPGTLTLQKLEAMLRLGVNRLSLGVQSFTPELLQVLGRVHNDTDAIDSFKVARQAGFKNINLDLMFALPGQTMEQLQSTIEQALRLGPEHISCYSLIIEDGTPFGELSAAHQLKLPGEDMEAAMFDWVCERLRTAGYEHYEISNFARPGYRCRHNEIYWRNEWYLGLGPGAHSHWNGLRYANHASPEEYGRRLSAMQLPIDEWQTVSPPDQMDETMMLGLRLLSGVTEERFHQRFSSSMFDVYGPQIERLEALGLIRFMEGALQLTERGLFMGNRVFAEFLR